VKLGERVISSAMRSLEWLLLAALLTATSSPAAAAPSSAKCRAGAESALGGIACELRRTLAGTLTAPVVVGIAPAGTLRAPLQPAIAVSAAVRLALELGPSAHAWPIAESGERARALARGSRPLLLVIPSIDGDRLAVSVEVLGPKSDANPKANETVNRASARRWLDAEVRRFLPAVPLATRTFKRAGSLDGDVIALACGGTSEAPTVASVGRQAVALAFLQGDTLAAPHLRTLLKDLAEVAPVPLREPLATAWFAPSGDLLIGTTDRATGKILRRHAGGAAWSDLSARLPWPGGACARLDGTLIAPTAVPCGGEGAAIVPELEEPLDAIAGASVVSRSGAVRLTRAGRRASDAAVTIRDSAREARIERAGAALALADLDGDGAPELASSLDTDDPAADAVVVHSWAGEGLVERFRVPVPTGVKALAICPARAVSMAPVVIATKNELWILQ
jgi:hypothetical protein